MKKKKQRKTLSNTRSLKDEINRDRTVASNLDEYGDVEAQRRGWTIFEEEKEDQVVKATMAASQLNK